MERDFRDKYCIAGARQKFEFSCLYLLRKKYGEIVQTIEPNPFHKQHLTSLVPRN